LRLLLNGACAIITAKAAMIPRLSCRFDIINKRRAQRRISCGNQYRFRRHQKKKERAKLPSRPGPDGTLDAIVEAGRFAPSGSNSQTTRFIVIRKKSVLEELEEIVTREFASFEVDENTYPGIRGSALRAKKGKINFLYGAPTFVVTANKLNYGNAYADCAAALENMMLAAVSLGVGSCWINQLRWLNGNESILSYLYGLGLQRDETVYGGGALGYSAAGEPAPLSRTGNPVTYVR
jgi:nitroreductase